MLHKVWNSKGEMPYCFPRSSIKFQGHTVQNITDFDPNWVFPDYRPVAAFKSLRFALFKAIHQISRSHRLKNWQIKPNLSKITRPVTAIKSLRFALFLPRVLSLPASVCLCVRPSVRPSVCVVSTCCPCDNSSPVQARITKYQIWTIGVKDLG